MKTLVDSREYLVTESIIAERKEVLKSYYLIKSNIVHSSQNTILVGIINQLIKEYEMMLYGNSNIIQ